MPFLENVEPKLTFVAWIMSWKVSALNNAPNRSKTKIYLNIITKNVFPNYRVSHIYWIVYRSILQFSGLIRKFLKYCIRLLHGENTRYSEKFWRHSLKIIQYDMEAKLAVAQLTSYFIFKGCSVTNTKWNRS